MNDEAALAFLEEKAATAKYVLSGHRGFALRRSRLAQRRSSHYALVRFSPVGILRGSSGQRARRSRWKTHQHRWRNCGVDGALHIASFLRGEGIAQQIQLSIEYEPHPPFHSGMPATAPAEVIEAVRDSVRGITDARLATARRFASRLGITGF